MAQSEIKGIRYKAGYKYQLALQYRCQTGIYPRGGRTACPPFVTLTDRGELLVEPGYAWDGASGPVPDTRQNMRASLVHDALYQLLRLEYLQESLRKKVDALFRKMCQEDGVWWGMPTLYYVGLRWFAGYAAHRDNARPMLSAP